MVLMDAREAMKCCAVAMLKMHSEDQARPDVRAIYQAAASVEIALATHAAAGHQADPRIPVPSWLTEFEEPSDA